MTRAHRGAIAPSRLPASLAAYLDAAKRAPFVWGKDDCTTFAADWCRRVTGRDPAEGLRGRWHSDVTAQGVIAAGGGLRRLGDRLGWPMREGAAEPGDIALLRRAGEPRTARRFAIAAAGFWAVKRAPVGVALLAPETVIVACVWAGGAH